MGENASKTGKKLEFFGENFFKNLEWIELARDKEIKCSRASHKKRTHGIDLLCKFKNPYLQLEQGVIIECKNYQMISITDANVKKWVVELINNIECAQSSPDLQDIDVSNITLNTGLLLIHANDKFDKEKFHKILNALQCPTRRNPINIFIAGNDKINLWTSILTKISLSFNNNFSFLYPSIDNSSKQLNKILTINAMYSKYIFAESDYYVKEGSADRQYDVPKLQSILFFLDTISIENFQYAWSMFKYYQLQGKDRYVFVFYPQNTSDVELVKSHFISTLKSHATGSDCIEIEKIQIEFLDNRDLSIIETGGVL